MPVADPRTRGNDVDGGEGRKRSSRSSKPRCTRLAPRSRTWMSLSTRSPRLRSAIELRDQRRRKLPRTTDTINATTRLIMEPGPTSSPLAGPCAERSRLELPDRRASLRSRSNTAPIATRPNSLGRSAESARARVPNCNPRRAISADVDWIPLLICTETVPASAWAYLDASDSMSSASMSSAGGMDVTRLCNVASC